MENETEKQTYLAHLDSLLEHHELFTDPTLKGVLIEMFEDFHILRAILMDPHPHYTLSFDGTLIKSESLAMVIGSIVSNSKYDLKNMDTNMASNLLNEIHHVFTTYNWLDSPRIIFGRWLTREKPSNKYYPMTGPPGYINHLVQYLEEIMVFKAKADVSLGPLKLYISRLQQMFQLVSDHLVRIAKISQQRKEDADLKLLVEGITVLAYETEYAVDLFLVRNIPIWYCVFWLRDIQNNLKPKLEQMNLVYGDMREIISQLRNSYSWEKITPIMNKIEINEVDEILKAAADDFDICTWSYASTYKERKKDVLLQLLRNASSNKGEYIDKTPCTSDLSEDELKKLVQVHLNYRSYFIILINVDNIQDLDEIRGDLPDDGYRRRKILLTSNSPKLVAYCYSGYQKDLFMSTFTGDHTSTSQTKKPTLMEGDVVGFIVETESMLERLIRAPKKLQIISIAGMPGQGKTTFARKLYNNSKIVGYFDRRVWCSVSQVYEKNELLLELLGQIVELSDAIRDTDEHELTELLWRNLKGCRFLVVLDDIWSAGAWDDLMRCFPDDKNGSRIIFTTRLQELASQVQPCGQLQSLDPLSCDESWLLLQNKIFDKEKESCPRELLGVGMEIAKHCKGLPLSVVLTAGLLKKTEKRKDVWEDIAETLSTRILGEADTEDKGVINLSYNHLPDFLKPCFLYCGAFLEDREIPVQKLIRLWIAEGFIQHTGSDMLEEVADGYLRDLIGRSLVSVSQEKTIGGVKSCRVHDLLREFALTKAREDNFLQIINGYDENFPSSNDNLHNGQIQKYSCSSEPGKYCQRRVCIYSKRNQFFISTLDQFDSLARSLLFFTASDMPPSHSYDVPYLFDSFKLLRILNFEDINIGNSFKGIDALLHLRYLAIQGTMVSIPSSISNLLHLETFCVKSLENEVVKVPGSIWNMEKLRHVHINDRASFDKLEDSFVLDILQTFSTPSLAYGDDMEMILRKLRGIRKLKCIFLDCWDDARKCNQFPVLEFLIKLESLKVFYNGEMRYPCRFNFPSNLKKLTLTNFGMPWSESSQLASLDHLEVLKLLCNAFEGERWEMEDDVFPKLKVLKLESLNVVGWVASCDNLPLLEHLSLHKCEQLEEIPSEIGDITTLLIIEVKWCSPSAADSAMTIQEEQLDFGNERLKVIVHRKTLDSESSS